MVELKCQRSLSRRPRGTEKPRDGRACCGPSRGAFGSMKHSSHSNALLWLPFRPQLHSDSDRGDSSVRYVLTGDGAGTIFKIDEKSGDIHATKRLDREEKAYYILYAKAVNRFTNEALEGQSEFIIKIHDINDNAPKFTKNPYTAQVPEMSDIGR